MGPNGSGKSTLAQVLAGRETYTVTEGADPVRGARPHRARSRKTARAKGSSSRSSIRSRSPGSATSTSSRPPSTPLRKHRGESELDAIDFLAYVREKLKVVDMDESFLSRSVNEGFSGGEKKRNEIFQMAVLDPKLAILDETDSGLDIDALKIVSAGVNAMRSEKRAIVVVTHYQRLLEYIVPDKVHVLADGRIVRSGDRSLALTLEKKGYAWLEEEVAR